VSFFKLIVWFCRKTGIKIIRISALLWLGLGVSACGSETAIFPAATETERQVALEKWARSCALCHVDGNGGAPRVGDAAWAPRLEQSTATLLDHTVNGLGLMPPLGYCMDCSEHEFLILIDFMSATNHAD
jgi:cytochrome c5